MGSEGHVGFADRVFHSGNGFRWDVTWLFWSNVLLFIAFVRCFINRDIRSARLSVVFIAAEFLAIVIYLRFSLLPNLYMG